MGWKADYLRDLGWDLYQAENGSRRGSRGRNGYKENSNEDPECS